MKRSQLENKYIKNSTVENMNRYKKHKNFYSKLYKKERKKFYCQLVIKNITDNKLFWITMKLSKKPDAFGNIPTKILRSSSDICNVILQNIWNSEILEKLYFPNKLKLADITPLYKKKDPILV